MKKFALMGLSLLSVFALAACSSDGSDVKSAVNAVSEKVDKAVTDQTETEKTEQIYGIGQVVKVGDVEYTVNSISQAASFGDEYFGEKAQGVFLSVNVTVKNNGKEALDVSDSFFKLYNGDVEYESNSSVALFANDDSSFFLEKINPGNAITSNVVFDIPQDVANTPGIQMQVQTGFWGTETAKINLQ